MKYKIYLFLLLVFIYIKKFFQYKLIYDTSIQNTSNIIPDIVISPGGRYGMYSLGICHYIKNNFNIKNKKIVGFSSGSWNGLFMCMKKKYINSALREGFKINNVSIPIMLKKTINIVKKYTINDFNIKNLYIGSSHFNKHMIYNKFITIDDVIRCCVSSSFVPFITYNDIIYFYKNKLSFDGGFYYKNYKKTLPSSTLIISFRMFGRHKNLNIFKEQLNKYKPTAYQLYIKGYHDAVKNHDYFKKYFT
jgi:hypothetical protein